MTGLIIISFITGAYCLLAVRLSRTILTAPMLFLALGSILSVGGMLPGDKAEALLHPLAEMH